MANLNTKVRAGAPRVNRDDVTCHHCWDAGHTRASCPLRHLDVGDARATTQAGRRTLDSRRRVMVGKIARLMDGFPASWWAPMIAEACEIADGYATTDKACSRMIAELRAGSAPPRRPAKMADDGLRAMLAGIRRTLLEIETAPREERHATQPGEAWMRAKVKA